MASFSSSILPAKSHPKTDLLSTITSEHSPLLMSGISVNVGMDSNSNARRGDSCVDVSLRPLEKQDLALIKAWSHRPHVVATWGDDVYEEALEVFAPRMNDGAVQQFIIEVDRQPVGYFQYYWASRVGGGWWDGIDPASVGFDLYIGEPSFLGRGVGSAVVRVAIDMLFSDERVKRIIVDPDPTNRKMIRLLEKAGFVARGEIKTPDGTALLMELLR